MKFLSVLKLKSDMFCSPQSLYAQVFYQIS